MHNWGDETVDWKGIDDAARFISGFLVRWGRVPVRDYKEKYGTVRVYLSFGWEGPHTITHPRHCYNRYPRWLWLVHCSRPMRAVFALLNRVVVPYHVWLYKRAYGIAVSRWPHLRKEICCAADYSELLDKKLWND